MRLWSTKLNEPAQRRTSAFGDKRTFGPNQHPKLVVCHSYPRAIVRMRIGLSTNNAMMAAAILSIAAT